MTAKIVLAVVVSSVLGGCKVSGTEPSISLERMIDQPRLDAYDASAVFADGKAMREPPFGTVAREALLGPPMLVGGQSEGQFAARIPVMIDEAGLRHGRNRFAIYCGVCHGERADGRSPVAERMTLRQPPSLVDPPLRELPLGRMFRDVTEGYGLMPSYADVLTVEERWQVIAFVEVLRLARRARLADLPEPWRQRALQSLAEPDA